ncbi:hypothetical protein P7K49_017945 [Saguinus oedipus]|uniref:Uncharacterized protein n=1 Tax=Saguinus oedipus TaxID=9490 RepID=A0ABQ9V3Z9_SAGOE|nr:hypothetical protein P7K49_017945 [Saguinus oedipus]
MFKNCLFPLLPEQAERLSPGQSCPSTGAGAVHRGHCSFRRVYGGVKPECRIELLNEVNFVSDRYTVKTAPFLDLSFLPESLARLTPHLLPPISPSDEFCGLWKIMQDSCGIRNQPRWFSLKTVSSQNTKATNLVAEARYLRKYKGSDNEVASDSPHFFSAGAAKKRSQMNPQSKEHDLPPVRNTIQLPTQPLNSEEWDRLKADFKGKTRFESWISSQMAQYHSPVDVAKSLLTWVAAKNNGIVDYDLLVRYLHLCVHHKQTSEVIDVYEIMKARYKILDSGGYTLLIRGLIQSDRWREAFLLLEDLKKVMTPSKKNYDDCIQGALLHQDINTAWNLYQELLGHDIIPMLETLKAFFDFGKDIKDDNYSNKLLDILLYLRNNQLYPGESFAHSIKTWFER